MKLLFAVIAICIVPAFSEPREFWDRTMRPTIPDLMYGVSGSLQCDLCQMAVKDIQTILSGKSQQAEDFVDQLCSDIPEQYQQECTNLMNEYLPLLFTLIDDMSPEEVCQLLTMCISSDDVELELPEFSFRRMMKYFRHNPAIRYLEDQRIAYLRSSIDDNYICDGCLDVITCIRNLVEGCNTTIEDVAAFLKSYCIYCPVKADCENFFDQLPVMFDQFVSEYLDPESDCKSLGFCPTEELEETPMTEPVEAEPEPEQESEEEEEEEEMMRDFENRAYNEIAKNTKYMNKKTFKKSYRDMFRTKRAINFISNHINTLDNDMLVPYDVDGPVPNQAKCEICSYFASAAEGVLVYQEQMVMEGLTELFTDICNALPDQFRSKCTNEVVDVAPAIIVQSLTKLLAPDTLCSEVFTICSNEQYQDQDILY